MIIAPGFTFLSRTPPYSTKHLYIIISIPSNNTKALFVNVTTKKANSDISCILKIGDHDFISRDSVINYHDAALTEIEKLEEAIEKEYFKPQKPINDDLLDRILNGARISDAFPTRFLKELPQ